MQMKLETSMNLNFQVVHTLHVLVIAVRSDRVRGELDP